MKTPHPLHSRKHWQKNRAPDICFILANSCFRKTVNFCQQWERNHTVRSYRTPHFTRPQLGGPADFHLLTNHGTGIAPRATPAAILNIVLQRCQFVIHSLLAPPFEILLAFWSLKTFFWGYVSLSVITFYTKNGSCCVKEEWLTCTRLVVVFGADWSKATVLLFKESFLNDGVSLVSTTPEVL